MSDNRKEHFERSVEVSKEEKSNDSGIWELSGDILDTVSGGADFYQSGPGAPDFAQGFSCFAQHVGDFSQGTPPPVNQDFPQGN